jgi:hypothetical protein
VPVASWLALRTGLTPHGLRHGHQTWLDDMGVRYVLQSERMGHEVPGMRGVYSHITPGMRAELKAGCRTCGRALFMNARGSPCGQRWRFWMPSWAHIGPVRPGSAPILLPESDIR